MDRNSDAERKSLPLGLLRGLAERDPSLGYWVKSSKPLHNADQEELHLNNPDRGIDVFQGDGLYWAASNPDRVSTPESNKQYRLDSPGKELAQANSTIVVCLNNPGNVGEEIRTTIRQDICAKPKVGGFIDAK
jgi:hypothetical protein